MDLSVLLSSSPARWSLPLALFLSVFGAFKVAEGSTSKQFKSDLSSFIKKRDYENYLGLLPNVIQNGFDKLFGKKHLSGKSATRSLLISLFATVLVVSFSAIYNYAGFKNTFINYSSTMQSIHDALAKNPSSHEMAVIVDQIKDARSLLIWIPVFWIFWCFIPDYLSLLKTRIIILVLKSNHTSLINLMVVFITDIAVSVLTFMFSFVFFQFVVLYLLYGYNNGFHFDFEASFIFFGIAYTFEVALFVLSGAAIFSVPIANLFWASALPSVWLWIYIFSALLARLLLASKPLLRVATYVLDFDEHPVNSLGVLAGALITTFSYVFLLVMEVVRYTK